MNVDSVTMATFSVLFRINTVANKRLGLFNNLMMALSEVLLLFKQSSRSSWFREKNATSDPDTIADVNKRINSTNKLIEK